MIMQLGIGAVCIRGSMSRFRGTKETGRRPVAPVNKMFAI